jgi:hypothetical protein
MKEILAEYDGWRVSFTDNGWFNASQAAEQFKKTPHEWLRLPSSRDYLAAIERRYGKIPYVKTSRSRKDRGGGTWLHPKLAVRFAQWLDVDFAIWCDEQIDQIMRSNQPLCNWRQARDLAASSCKVMNDILKMMREESGKITHKHHFMTEARLVNWALSGEFKKLDRDALDAKELAMLADLEQRNAVLLARGLEYEERKSLLAQYALKWRTDALVDGGRQI